MTKQHFKRYNRHISVTKQQLCFFKRQLKKNFRKILGLVGLLLRIFFRLCPWEIPQSSPAQWFRPV